MFAEAGRHQPDGIHYQMIQIIEVAGQALKTSQHSRVMNNNTTLPPRHR